MKICDICFCELKEESFCQSINGVQKDICRKCLNRLESKNTNKDDETLVKEYITLIEEKGANIENLIFKLKSESPNRYSEILRIDEADICCKS